jgi:hypothetical protein
MANWAGWGAGPAGAGATGGPSRIFLTLALLGAAVLTAILAVQGRWAAAAVTALGAVYFALRLLGGLGKEDR